MGILDWFKGLFKSENEPETQEKKKEETYSSHGSLQDPFVEETPIEREVRNGFGGGAPVEEKPGTPEAAKPAELKEKGSLKQPPKRIIPIRSQKADSLNIWVGLDLGTSSVKATYRVLGAPEKKIHPLRINPESRENPFVLPSLAAFTGKGDLLLAEKARRFLSERPWEEGIRYLKLLYAGQLDEEYYDEIIFTDFHRYCSKQGIEEDLAEPGCLLSVYIAAVIRKVRNNLSEIFSGSDLNINFNICLPIDTYEKEEVRKGFQKVLNAAQRIEADISEEATFTEMLARAPVTLSGASPDKDAETRMHLIPEAVAQTASYVTSLSAEQKIHCVIDFGAGTTDFSIFNLAEEEQGKCTFWYNAKTFPGGTQRIENIIARHYRDKGKVLTHKEVANEIRSGVKDKELGRKVREVLESIWQEARYPVWGKAYGKNKLQSTWMRDNVEIFVCGGGSRLPFVREVFSKCWHQRDWGPYKVSSIKPPKDFDVSNKDFCRLSVAYGLSFPEPELNRYVLPSACPDQTPQKIPAYVEPANQGAVYPDTH